METKVLNIPGPVISMSKPNPQDAKSAVRLGGHETSKMREITCTSTKQIKSKDPRRLLLRNAAKKTVRYTVAARPPTVPSRI